MAPIADALHLARESIFNVRREYVVPRVVILFNESPSSNGMNKFDIFINFF